MATKKSTTSKAKTNTRKAAAKTTRPSSTRAHAARSAAKGNSTTAKAAVVHAVATEPRSVIRRLLELQRISVGVFILLALLAGYFMKSTTINTTLGYLTHDDLASKTSTVFAPAVHGIYDVNLRWVVVVIMVLSAVLPLLWTFRWRRQYEVNIDAEAMPQRWIDYAITSALMVETVALLSGIHDIMTLKVLAGMIVLSGGLAWLADRENRLADKAKWSAYVFSFVAGALPWVMIAVTAIATYFYGMIRSPWYVYALYAAVLLGFILTAWVQRRHYKRANQWKFGMVERNYTLINLLTKAAFAIILIVGLHR